MLGVELKKRASCFARIRQHLVDAGGLPFVIHRFGGNMPRHNLFVPMIISGLLCTATSIAAEIIAGVVPSERPADAPIVITFDKTAKWYAEALTGVEAPYPASLKFLEDQGAWFNPFTKPGMPGPYDIRKWHDVK